MARIAIPTIEEAPAKSQPIRQSSVLTGLSIVCHTTTQGLNSAFLTAMRVWISATSMLSQNRATRPNQFW